MFDKLVTVVNGNKKAIVKVAVVAVGCVLGLGMIYVAQKMNNGENLNESSDVPTGPEPAIE